MSDILVIGVVVISLRHLTRPDGGHVRPSDSGVVWLASLKGRR